MSTSAATTRYATLSPLGAVLVLAMTIGSVDWCLIQGGGLASLNLRSLRSGLSDSILYKRVSARVRAGEGYYHAASTELKTQGYHRSSLFHWRMPVYAWFLGGLPSRPWAQAILGLGLLLGLTMASRLVSRDAGAPLGAFTATALVLACGGWLLHPEPVYFMEIWSGVALLIAACFQAQGRRMGATVAGAIALGLRELALPFCALSCVVAWRQKREREALTWCAIIAGFLLTLWLHNREVRLYNDSVSVVSNLGWFAFGGTKFLLSCCRMTYVLMALPPWCTAIYLPLALLGLYGWASRAALPFQRAVAGYLLLFAFVGKPFDFYWGWMFTPWLAIGAAWAPVALRDLVVAIAR